MSENGISIELSKAQVNRVIREAVEDGGLLGRVGETEKLGFRASPEQLDDPGLSSSLLRGLMVLVSFPADGAGRSMTDVADELEMGTSTTHRYVSTLLEVGLLERDPVSRKYRLAVRG
jgi:DNA-binding MarR family transcriptional regulator